MLARITTTLKLEDTITSNAGSNKKKNTEYIIHGYYRTLCIFFFELLDCLLIPIDSAFTTSF
jgi:hypothetical protein